MPRRYRTDTYGYLYLYLETETGVVGAAQVRGAFRRKVTASARLSSSWDPLEVCGPITAM